MSTVTAPVIAWITLLCLADCSLISHQLDDAAPTEVEFHSLDFKNVLYWKQPHAVVHNLKYFVQHKVYGDKEWTNTERCQGIKLLHCDLSQETSDPREWYYARVQSLSAEGHSSWVISSRFHPHWDTSFSPPKIQPSVTGQTIKVRIRPPRTPLEGPKGTKLRVTKLQKLLFRIYLMHNGVEEEVLETDSCSKELVMPRLRPKTTYCLQAMTLSPHTGRRSARSSSTCISTH
ncbi:interleukin-22 receptor subunit alpha-2 [Paramisgurnus dabryanus]|uniref:interleukin-22 receptor subunit alpha-2 n=1 Tax=Paramisgurnus dabryanus TaxID=90735 RepID=UPI0031F3CBEE